MSWEPTYKERFPEWRSSEGILKERKPEGIESLTGYESSEKEKTNDDVPEKIWEIGNSYGTLEIGRNKKKQLIIVNSQHRSKDIHALPEESKVLKGDSSVKIPLLTGAFRINENWNRREESAYDYRIDSSKVPIFIMKKMQNLLENYELNVQENINPFFSAEKEKEELAYLRAAARQLSREPSSDSDPGLEKRIQFLSAVVADKERLKINFYNRLPVLLEKARQARSHTGDDALFVMHSALAEITEEHGLTNDDALIIISRDGFSVNYHPNGATGGQVPVDENTYQRGETVLILGNSGHLSRAGFTFRGWSLSPQGEDPVYIEGSSMEIEEVIDLYAFWEKRLEKK